MLWSDKSVYQDAPFDLESELEQAVLEVAPVLFGSQRVYLDTKKKIGLKGKKQNVPDGYLIDLSSTKEPKLFVVENEIAKHDPLKHVAVQILGFSLAFETSQHRVKSVVKEALVGDTHAFRQCENYAGRNGFENVDVLLERMVYGEDKFNALVIIDELVEELEKVLISRFQFPVEILTLERYRSASGENVYRFEPFLTAVSVPDDSISADSVLDPSEIDTIVVPAREDGFKNVFLGEDRWYSIRIHSSMIPKIKYIAAYQISPESAITHIAPVASIEQWRDTSKYVVNFAQPAERIGPIRLVPKGKVKALQASRYTARSRLESAADLEAAF